MKKFLLSCLLFIVTCINAQINLGVGSTTMGTAPISTYYGYSYVQQIFTKSEINANAAGNITGLKFYLSPTATLTNSSSWKVYLGHTTNTSFTSTTSWIPLTGLTQVFSGTISNVGGVVQVTLTTPFAYNNVDNLVIAAIEDSPNYDNNTFTDAMYVYTTASNRSIYYRSDVTVPSAASPPTATGRNGYNSAVTILGLAPSPIPACPTVSVPAAAATGVDVLPVFTWGSVSGATGYRLSVGTTPGGTNILNNFDVGNVTTYTLTAAQALQYNTQYYYTVSSYSATNPSAACTGNTFTTKNIPCPTVSAPAAGANGVSVTPTVTWAAVTGATGYRITVGSTAGGTNVLNNVDLGNVTSYTFTTPLANSSQYFYKINAYNATSTSSSCTERNFKTACLPFTALPWNENFDGMTTLGAGILPPCWTNVTGTSAWTSSSAAASTTSPGPRSPANYVRIQYGNTNASQLWTPGFALTAGTSYEFSFYYHTGGNTSGLMGYTGNVLVNTSQSTTGATSLGTFITATQGTANYTQYKVYYTPTTSGTYNFGVNTSSNFTPWYLGVDDFKLRVAPTCMDPQGFSVLNTTTTSTTVQWTVPTPAPAGGYDVYYTTTNTPPLPGTTPQYTGVAGPSQLISGLTTSTTYYIWVRARCSATDIGDWTGPLSVFTNYCLPSAGSSSTTYYVNNITTTGGLTNLAYTASSYTAYVNNSAQSFSVVPGNSAAITVGGSSTASKYYYIWVDWNNDMVFDTAPGSPEIILATTTYSTAPGTATINSTGHPSGNYRIRFAISESGVITPCGPANYGSYVDYTFIIKPCSTTAPTNVTVTGINNVSATVNWSPSVNNLNYRVYWRVAGTTPWVNSSPILAPPQTSYVINGVLQPSTNYEVKVVAICGTTEGTATPVPFATTCDPTPPNVSISQVTDISALITWNPIVPNASYELQWRKVGDPVWTQVVAPTLPQPPFNSYTITGLSSFVTYEVQVRSKCTGSLVGNPWSNTQVFTTVRLCQIPPPGLTITTLTPTSAEVVWDAYTGSGATGTYILKYRKVGIPSWTTVTVNTNTYTITGLLELTKYEMQVANVCSGTPGNFTPLYYFTTPTVVYCPMSGGNSASEFISKVTAKPTGKPEMINETLASPTGYADYTGVPSKVIEMIQGSNGNKLTIDKTLSSGANAGVAVWIDFNRNGYFDINERIMADGPNTNPTASTTFSVPADAFVSMTDFKYVVMRVAMQKDGIPVNCTSFANGEVEDYTVKISKIPAPNSVNQTDILIYPNPVSTVLYVKNISKKANYKIYSASGQLVSNGLILNNKIDVSRLISGMYVIDIEDAKGSVQKKFIKE